jgi:hypothetical protein
MNTNITLEQALDRIAVELCKRELQYRIASIANDQPTLANPEDWYAFDVRDGDMGEMLMEKFVARLHEFETRPQAVEYLVSKGMSPEFAKAAIDQQYNYDKPDDTNEPLRNGPEEEDEPTTQSVADLDMVYNTWVELLSTDEQGNICVDGEPTYDAQGNLL